MKYYNTNNKTYRVSFRQAVLEGLAPDGGLYMPESYPKFSKDFLTALSPLSFAELAFQIARHFVDDIPSAELEDLCQTVFTFDTPLIELSPKLSVLELFHGPTLAFKDFGARFLAALIQRYTRDSARETLVLVATSGDTGSAVAKGFLGMEGVKVALLYPGGMVSRIQEQQLTTIGGNVTAFEVQGTFDSCQTLVKRAFQDDELQQTFNLSPANSINIARLLPQSFYYFRAFTQFTPAKSNGVHFVVPSGNLGNLTAGLMAARMGLPVRQFVAAVNGNRFFPDYLQSGNAQPRRAVRTCSNAMDVGNPGNFTRILDLFDGERTSIRSTINSIS
ncbi:MAG TPA: threonine synthase, partial [Calditrichaeota bacterium]|nr:threonine synthase [Calditrichota bacterium]